MTDLFKKYSCWGLLLCNFYVGVYCTEESNNSLSTPPNKRSINSILHTISNLNLEVLSQFSKQLPSESLKNSNSYSPVPQTFHDEELRGSIPEEALQVELNESVGVGDDENSHSPQGEDARAESYYDFEDPPLSQPLDVTTADPKSSGPYPISAYPPFPPPLNLFEDRQEEDSKSYQDIGYYPQSFGDIVPFFPSHGVPQPQSTKRLPTTFRKKSQSDSQSGSPMPTHFQLPIRPNKLIPKKSYPNQITSSNQEALGKFPFPHQLFLQHLRRPPLPFRFLEEGGSQRDTEQQHRLEGNRVGGHQHRDLIGIPRNDGKDGKDHLELYSRSAQDDSLGYGGLAGREQHMQEKQKLEHLERIRRPFSTQPSPPQINPFNDYEVQVQLSNAAAAAAAASSNVIMEPNKPHSITDSFLLSSIPMSSIHDGLGLGSTYLGEGVTPTPTTF